MKVCLTVVLAALLAFTGTAHAATLLEGQRTGGFAGVQDYMTITTRGSVTLTTRGEKAKHKLSSRWLARVKRHVKAGRKARLAGAYGENNVADGFVYGFRFAGRTVIAQGFEDHPPALEALIKDFGLIYEQASPRR